MSPIIGKSRSKSTDRILIGVSVALILVASLQVLALYQSIIGLPSPISISACKPDLDPCIQWFDRAAGEAQSRSAVKIQSDMEIRVVGETCNTADTALSYHIEIDWYSIDLPDLKFRVLEAPITWDVGCTPYDFIFVVPDSLTANSMSPGESLGRYVLSGRATPLSAEVKVVRWGITDVVEIVKAE